MEEKKEKKSKKDKQKKNKDSGHKKLKSSGQLMSTTHNFSLAIGELPESFFEKMVLTEIDLSEEFTMDRLYDLIRLYSEAIEYYNRHDPSQVEYFRGRMEFFLTNKDMLKKLKKESQLLNNKYKSKKENNSDDNNNNIIELNSDNKILNMNDIKKEKIKNLNKSELKKNIENRTDNLLFDDISKKINKVMEENNINNQQNKKGIDIITQDLKKQNEKWKEKLKNKKKNKFRVTQNIAQNRKMKHQKGLSLDLMKNFSENIIGRVNINIDEEKYEDEDKDKDEIDMDQFEKMQNVINEGIFEEVKEENEEEGNDKENEIKFGNDNKNEIVICDKFEDFDDDKNNMIIDNIENEKKSLVKKEDIKEQEAEVEIDEKILTSVNERMDLLMKLIDDIENNKLEKDEDEENMDENNIKNEKDELNFLSNMGNVPLKFQSTYFQVENLIRQYMDQFNNFFFKEIFEQFTSNLKEIYDNKYKKYIEVSLEYHHQIKENEHLLENHEDYSEEKKSEIQQIIDSLKEEQQNQIATIEDEFNRLIVSKVNEFKIDSFKKNSGILLIEEKLKLEIYSIINESFYGN